MSAGSNGSVNITHANGEVENVPSGGVSKYVNSGGQYVGPGGATTIATNQGGNNNYNPYSHPADNDLYNSDFHSNYVTGNALWTDPRVNNAQRAMIESNFYAKQAGNQSPYSQQQIGDAAKGGYVGYALGPNGKGASYAYVSPYQTGGQNYISPTMRTNNQGQTLQYRGYANEPIFGSYAKGTSSPQDMNYSWERTVDPVSGNFSFNPAGAASAAAKDITVALTPMKPTQAMAGMKAPASSLIPSVESAKAVTGNTKLTPSLGAQATKQAQDLSNALTLRDLVSQKGLGNVGYDPATRQVTIGNTNYLSGQIPGTTLKNGTHYVTDSDMFLSSLTPSKPVSTAEIPTVLPQDLIDLITLKNYQQPDYSQIIPPMPVYNPTKYDYTLPTPVMPSLTSNPADTVYIPTLAFLEKQQQAKQLAADQNYKDYTAQLTGWNYQNDARYQQQQLEQQERQNLIKNYLDFLPYTPDGLTAAQRAQIEQNKAQAQAEAAKLEAATKQQERENAILRTNAFGRVANEVDAALLGVPVGTKTDDARYREASLRISQQKASGSGSGGSVGSGGPNNNGYYLDTEGERTNVSTGQLLDRALTQCDQNSRAGGSAGEHPLYYTLDTLFNNPNWQKAATSSGADVLKVADQLIVKYAKVTPKEYFSSGKAKGSRVEAAYKSLLSGKKSK